MRKMALLLLAGVLSISASGATRRRAVKQPPPDGGLCSVRGLPNIFISTDRGRTFSTNSAPRAIEGSNGLVIQLDDPNRLVITVNSRVYDSTDAGCSWTLRYTVTDVIHHALRSVPSTAGRAYVWTEEVAFRYDAGEVRPIAIPEQIGGFGVDPANRNHVRILGLANGQTYESLNGGDSWAKVGRPAGTFVAAAGFDPFDFNHILIGQQSQGLMVTRDGGATWSAAPTPYSRTAITCRIEFVPNSMNVVWVTRGTSSGVPSVFRSANGGASYDAIGTVEGVENNVCYSLAPNPHDSNLAVMAIGNLRTFDAVTKTVTESSCCNADISRIIFSPANADVIYIYGAPR